MIWYIAGPRAYRDSEGRDFVSSLTDVTFVEPPRTFTRLRDALDYARAQIGRPVLGGTVVTAMVAAYEPRSRRFPAWCGGAISVAAYADADGVPIVRPRRRRPTETDWTEVAHE